MKIISISVTFLKNMNCTYVNVFQLYQKCYEYLVVHYIFTVFISIGSQHILHLLLNNSPSLRWTIYTNFLHLKWLYDKIIMKMSETLSHLSISGVKSRVLKLSFLILKMMVKSGLEFILKFTEPLQRYLFSCQANSAILGRYFFTGQQQLWSG